MQIYTWNLWKHKHINHCTLVIYIKLDMLLTYKIHCTKYWHSWTLRNFVFSKTQYTSFTLNKRILHKNGQYILFPSELVVMMEIFPCLVTLFLMKVWKVEHSSIFIENQICNILSYWTHVSTLLIWENMKNQTWLSHI